MSELKTKVTKTKGGGFLIENPYASTIKNKIRYEKCYSKKSKRLWLKVHPMDESNHWDFFHSIDTYVKFVLDD